jgi:hypothetical protein
MHITKIFQTEISQPLYNKAVPPDFMEQRMIPLNLQHHYITSVSDIRERNTSSLYKIKYQISTW